MMYPKLFQRPLAHARGASASRVRKGTGISCPYNYPCAYAHGLGGNKDLMELPFRQTRNEAGANPIFPPSEGRN